MGPFGAALEVHSGQGVYQGFDQLQSNLQAYASSADLFFVSAFDEVVVWTMVSMFHELHAYSSFIVVMCWQGLIFTTWTLSLFGMQTQCGPYGCRGPKKRGSGGEAPRKMALGLYLATWVFIGTQTVDPPLGTRR